MDRAVSAARRAFTVFSGTSRSERIELIENFYRIFKRRSYEIAEIVTIQTGMPISVSSGSLIGFCEAHIAKTLEILKEFNFEVSSGITTVRKEPIGVIGLITPWNWPIGQILTKLLPALATGCTTVLKPSEYTPLDAVIVAEMLDEARFPPGVFNLVQGDGATVGDAITRHPDVDMISFTGSTRAGVQISKSAADTVKRVVHELGGKSANILLKDADFQNAVPAAVENCFHLSGQACDAGTRLLVPHDRLAQVVTLACDAADKMVVGSPNDTRTNMGPLVNEQQFDLVQAKIAQGIDEGANIVCGGLGRPEGNPNGFFVRPTIFSDVTESMSIFREEIFGPVLSIVPYHTYEQAIDIANNSHYGLAAYVAGSDISAAQKVANSLRVGSVYVNSPPLDAGAPYGGYRQSGNGRECGEYGFHECLELKSIIGIRV
ncbi:aldehyde dehydrogenase family protein [Pseudomonas sp. NY15181]|uniref:aldehyde dehydrogenase family protein n=1 Tax=Pseudomonas sp. NY15181 TaxID=3400349 RepID=UPI003A88712B